MISVLIPAFNEEKRIGMTIQSVYQTLLLQDEEFEIITIDDGSKDNTGEIARMYGAKVISLLENLGKGRAMNHGLKEAKGEILLLIDADLKESAKFVKELLQPILYDKADMTIGKFPSSGKKGGFGLVKGLARYGLNYFTGEKFEAPISGQRALKRDVMKKIGLFQPGWGMEVALTIDAHYHGFRILEVPLEMTHRETGRNLAGFKHRGEQFVDIFSTLLRSFWRYRSKKGGKNL